MMHLILIVINYEFFPQKLAKMVCLALCLPFPSDTSNPGGEDTGRNRDANAKKTEQCMTNKLLLVGCDQSGTSTIFKQVRCSWWNVSSSNYRQKPTTPLLNLLMIIILYNH